MTTNTSNVVNGIFDDLDRFLDFCRDFGYRYNEADLYNWKSYAYQQYMKYQNGKRAKNMWEVDRSRSHRRNNNHNNRK